MQDRQIEAGKAIQRQTGRTFHIATRLLPERARHPTYVLYGFFRIADEVVDGAETLPPPEQAERLEQLRAEALGEVESEEPVLRAFAELKAEYDIADEEVVEFVDAMKSDIDTDRYETYEELEAYMRGSASAVGVMMTDIIEPDEYEAALPHAIALGKAFQLSNFLRDVREDVLDRNRIYLPLETLEKHDVTEAEVANLQFSDRFAAAMQEELQRAERLYRDGVAGIKFLPRDCQFAVLLSAVLYAEHHRLIRKQGYDVLSTEPELGLARSLALVAKTRWYWFWNKDPEAVFRRVSAVPYGDHEGDAHRREHGEGVATR
jgi:phytoene synthase